ncbi:unnamed protein product [Moneuplotes crassus]|uniref:Uncharacterized protein n=1 Tax=Euplotes crassus TaxID=5936 RepID=A0AAD1X8Y9_EUPCR|nr:unnamed protein product [Moneuplotes crassus]
MVIPKSGRRFANSISLKSQYFNMWSPKKRGIPSNASFAADMDDTFTKICEGESSVSKNFQNSQPSSRKKKTINDLPSQQPKLLELARADLLGNETSKRRPSLEGNQSFRNNLRSLTRPKSLNS